MQLEILYEDLHCLVMNKPAGLAVQPGHGMQPDEKTLLNSIQACFHQKDIPFSSDVVLVHRLDKDTTGCLLVAKNRDVHALLQQQFEDRTVKKIYLALVTGIPKHRHAIIDAPIGRHVSQRTKMGVTHIAKSREAKTEYRILQTGDKVALLECIPQTGRTHQIRVHLTSIGHPIVGDTKYGSVHHGSIPLCLHAWKLSFDSPVGCRVQVEAPIPEEFRMVLDRVGIVSP